MAKRIVHDYSNDGINRRGFLECMAWAGSGVVWTVSGGLASSQAFGQKGLTNGGDMTFVQISDSHMGFTKPANPDVTGTLRATVDKLMHFPNRPTSSSTQATSAHTSKPAEFDTMDQVLMASKQKQFFFVPGEHDNSSMTASCTWSATDKTPRARVGTVSIIKAFTLWDW